MRRPRARQHIRSYTPPLRQMIFVSTSRVCHYHPKEADDGNGKVSITCRDAWLMTEPSPHHHHHGCGEESQIRHTSTKSKRPFRAPHAQSRRQNHSLTMIVLRLIVLITSRLLSSAPRAPAGETRAQEAIQQYHGSSHEGPLSMPQPRMVLHTDIWHLKVFSKAGILQIVLDSARERSR